jgi:hypothetical protein
MTYRIATHFQPSLRRWSGRFCFILALGLATLRPQEAPAAEALTTAAAVRGLSVAQAQQRAPVRLRGVVTFFDEVLYSRFIQDETAGIYLRESTNTPALQPGQLVEVEGIASPGRVCADCRTGTRSHHRLGPLPAPNPSLTNNSPAAARTVNSWKSPASCARCNLMNASQHHRIEIATGGGRLTVFARNCRCKRIEELLDSTVRVRGVCSTRFNHQRQLFSIRLMVPRPEDLVIEHPAPPEPFAIATRPINSLLQFAPQETYGHRVKVAGTVIYYEPGRLLVLQEGDQGLEVQTQERDALTLGDRVEVLGFVGQGEYTPVLQDAVYRKVASGTPPPPARSRPMKR